MSPYTPVTPPRRPSTPPGRPTSRPPAQPPTVPPKTDADETEPEALPRIQAGQVDPAMAIAILVGLGLLVVASLVLAFLPTVVAAWVMGGLLLLIVAWAAYRFASGKGFRLGGQSTRAGGRRPGGRSVSGGRSLFGGRGPGRAGNGRFSRLGGDIRRAANRRFPRASRAAGRAADRVRAGASRARDAAARAAGRVPLPRRVRAALNARASRAAGRAGPRRSGDGARTGAASRRGGAARPGGASKPSGGRPSGTSRNGGGKSRGSSGKKPQPKGSGVLGRLVKVIPAAFAPSKQSAPGKDKDTGKDNTDRPVETDRDDRDEDIEDDYEEDEDDAEPDVLSRAERRWYQFLDHVRFWGKAAIEPVLPAPPDLKPFETGIDVGPVPPPPGDLDIHTPVGWHDWPADPSPAADERPPESPEEWVPADDDGEDDVDEPPSSWPPAPPKPSSHVSPHRPDQPRSTTATISTRSTTMAVDVNEFQHHFAEATTPAQIAAAYNNASQDAYSRSNEMEEQAQVLHAEARKAAHLPDAAAKFRAEASKREDDRDSYRRLATHWKNQALEHTTKTA
ncbi:hypothetical protein AB0425_17670 [Actinosynnema sp. NPDC051121]